MITKCIPGDIFKSGAKHIAFAINTDGYNDAGFAGDVSRDYWPEIANCGYHELGKVLSKTVGDITFHALVCHSLKKDGWGTPEEQRETIKKCFNNIPVEGEPITSIAIGTGFIGRLSGARADQIIYGMMDSDKEVYLSAGFDLEENKECYAEENDRIAKEEAAKAKATEEKGKAKTKNRKNG